MPPTRQRPYRRRRLLVDRRLQLRFVRVVVLVLLLTSLAVVGGVCAALWFTLYSFELLKDANLVALFNTITWTVVLELIVLVPIVSWLGILLTHKIAGPLVRIHAALAEMANGTFDIHIKLRKGDALVDLAEDINRLAAYLRSRSHS